MPLNTTPKFITAPAANEIDAAQDVIASGTGFLVAWNRTKTTGEQTVLLQKFNAFGVAEGRAMTLDSGTFTVAGRPELVDLGGNKVAAFWEKGGNVVGKVINLATGAAGPLKTFGHAGDSFHEAVLLDNGNVALTFGIVDARNPFALREQVSLVVTDGNLNIVKPLESIHGSGFPINFINEFDATVVDTANGGLVIYRDREGEQLFAKSFTDAGKLGGPAYRINSTAMKTPTGFDEVTFNVKATSLEGGKILVTWTSLENTPGSHGYEIRARLLNANGIPLGQDFLVNVTRAGTQYYPEVLALDGGKFAISWIEDNLVIKSHMIRYFDANGVPMSDPLLSEGPMTLSTTTDHDSAVLADGSIVDVTGTPGFSAPLKADGIPKPVFGTAASELMGGTTKADVLIAGGGHDTIAGGSGNDVLDGMAGNDKLSGHVGSDVLVGGNGRDFFHFAAPLSNDTVDRILDFSVVDDAMLLEDKIFTGLKRGALLEAQFHIGLSANAPEQRIVYDKGNGIISFDPDGNGPQAQVQFALVTPNLDITRADFLVV